VEDELKALLQQVSDKGLRVLTLEELDRLRALLSEKEYGPNKKADRSKKKLMKQINVEIYNRHNPRRFF
jgi:hypothetical protein